MKEKILTVENEMRECFKAYSPYSFDYSSASLQNNLDYWAVNKQWLFQVLKLHPEFDEDALAIVTTGKVIRKACPTAIYRFGECLNLNNIQHLLEKLDVLSDENEKKITHAKIYNWAMRCYFMRHADDSGEVNDVPEIRTEYIERRKKTHESYFEIACKLKKEGPSLFIPEMALALILGHLQIKPGMKKSRAFMKFLDKIQPLIDKEIKYDIHRIVNDMEDVPPVKNENGEETYFYNYNQLIALLCDLLSPKEIDKPLIISIHPCDYITQSHGNGWKSCHSFKDDECYNGATLTMLTDSTSIIAYFLEEKAYKKALETGRPLWAVRKSMRLILFANHGVILQNMVYPAKSLAYGDQASTILKELISKHDNILNTWEEVTTGHRDLYIDTSQYQGYKDWEATRKYRLFINENYNLSRFDLKIGHEAYCYDIETFVRNNKMIAVNVVNCDWCGGAVDEEDAYYVEGFDGVVCRDCLENEDDFYRCRGDGFWYYEPRYPSIIISDRRYNLEYAERFVDFVICENCGDAVYSVDALYIIDNDRDDHSFCCDCCLEDYVGANAEMFEEADDEDN